MRHIDTFLRFCVVNNKNRPVGERTCAKAVKVETLIVEVYIKFCSEEQ